MAITWNGNYAPASEDMWNLVEDMRKQAVLNNRVIPVYSASERDGLAGLLTTAIPDGTVVLRMDQSARGAVFDVFMDGQWMVGDTGVLTSGVGITASGVVTLSSYSFRRRGTVAVARVDFTYTGAKVTGNTTDGNISPNVNLFQVGGDWVPIWATYDITLTRPGASQHFGAIDADGWVTLANTLPGNVLDTGTTLRFDGSWQVA